MRWILAFIAGFLAVPLGHQIMLTLLRGIGFAPFGPWDFTPVPPLGVPNLLSQSFWGGVWGMVFALIEPRLPRAPALYWSIVAVFGAVALTGVYVAVVMPLKGAPPPVGSPVPALVSGLLVNAAWGVMAALLLRLAARMGLAQGRS